MIIPVNKSDLIGKYLGETKIKTVDVLERNKNNLLMIPEIEGDYSEECIQTINEFIQERPNWLEIFWI